MISGLTGAGLGIFNFVTGWREKQRRVHMTLTYQAPDAQAGLVGSAVLAATNPGHKTVLLQSAGLLLPNGQTVVYIRARPIWYGNVTWSNGPPPSLDPPEDNHSLPYHLPEGEHHLLLNSANAVAESIRREGLSGQVQLRGFYLSALGTMYKSKPLTFDTEEWRPRQAEESA
jgi:hypothetical protein